MQWKGKSPASEEGDSTEAFEPLSIQIDEMKPIDINVLYIYCQSVHLFLLY